jgi:hypothetical protein
MSSIVIAGDTSGSVTLQAPAVAGSTVLNLPATSGTIQASGAGYTTNGVAYATSATGLVTGSALTFDGTNFGVGGSPANVINAKSATQYKGVQVNNATNTIAELIGFNASNEAGGLKLYNAGSPIVQILSDGTSFLNGGNVGIGLTAPSARLHVRGASGSYTGGIIAQDATGNFFNFFGYGSDGVIGTAGNIRFATFDGSSERARITSAGNLLVGISTGTAARIFAVSDIDNNTLRSYNSNASFTNNLILCESDRNTTNGSYNAIGYYNNGASVYRFKVLDSGNVQNTNNSYGAISDVKLKENIVDASPKLADLMQVNVRSYNFKSDPTHKQLGVIAQELETVFPAMIEQTPDTERVTTIDENGEEVIKDVPTGTYTKSVKYSVFVPMLIKALQEQQALITTLTERITALEGV